jgi:class 3 adenylate cyclase
MQPEDFEKELALIRDGWESGEFVRSYVVPLLAPSRVGDDAFARRMVESCLAACSKEDAVALSEMWWEIDFRAILSSVCVPTLVMGPEDAAEETAYLAARISGARQVVIPGNDHLGWAGETDAVTNAIRDFISEVGDEEAEFDRVLATVLFTDIVGSTAYAASIGDRRWNSIRTEHDRIVRSHLTRFRGREIKTMGDGFLATFDGPARAIRCSLALAAAVRRLGIEIRAGLHSGEVESADEDVSGITVAIGARVAATAGPSEVLISQTVRDLVAGSGLAFEDAGEHDLKGVPGRWRLYRAVS